MVVEQIRQRDQHRYGVTVIKTHFFHKHLCRQIVLHDFHMRLYNLIDCMNIVLHLYVKLILLVKLLQVMIVMIQKRQLKILDLFVLQTNELDH